MTRVSSVRRRMSMAVVVISALLASLLGTGVAQAVTSTSYFINAGPSTAPHSYKISMQVYKSSSGTSLTITLTRSVTTLAGAKLTQTHNWSFSLSPSDVTIDPTDLVPTKIDTGTDMGKFGHIAMQLRNPSSLKSATSKCSNGTVTGSSKRRTGTFKGTFQFNAHDGFFGSIAKSALAGLVQKFVSNGKFCPFPSCFTGISFSASDTVAPLTLNAFEKLSKGPATITLYYSTTDAPASIFHSITGVVARSNFTLGSTGNVTVKAGSMAPMAADTIHFRGSNKHVSTVGHCKTTSFRETYASGDVVAKFQSGGSKKMNGPNSDFSFESATKTQKV